MNKWDYIELISEKDNKYRYLLLELMDKYKKFNLREVTEQEAKEFYEEMIVMNEKEKIYE